MALENLISVEFTQQELQKFDQHLAELEKLVQSKFISLTAEQRQEYSRLGTKTEDWVGRAKDYMAQYPDLVLRHIDTAEFNKDFNARQALLPRLRRIKAIEARIDDTALALGSDLYSTAISYYKGLKASAETNAPNAQSVYNDLKQQFPGRPISKKSEMTNNTSPTDNKD